MPVDNKVGLTMEGALELAQKMGFTPKGQDQAAETFINLYKLFNEKDATQVEINPLSESSDNQGKSYGKKKKELVLMCMICSSLYGCQVEL
ncbi:hypothetical protein G6F68_019043 [Rhizopus microsporus]|nr:hypothetical protein G6F68_019043 [Rhizopus microsporus]